MTGKDLIIYILNNNLENEPVFKDGTFLGFKTVNEVAEECGVGKYTVLLWTDREMIPCVHVGSEVIIPANYISPLKKK